MGKVVAIDEILSDLVDDFAPVRLSVDQFRPTINLHDRLWSRIKTHLASKPNEKPVTLRGKKYIVEIDACQPARKVKPLAAVFEKLKKLFGTKRYYELVQFPVTPIDALLDDEHRGEYIDTTQTGPRKILSVELIVPKAA
jgi:hypothetical protein